MEHEIVQHSVQYSPIIKKMPEALKSAEKVFKRFFNYGDNIGWSIGKDKWDAVAFIPNKDVLIVGTMMPEYKE